jgi:hypothetical protein
MSVASYNYPVYAIRQSFVDSPAALKEEFREGQFERLENIDCINAYAKMLQWSRGDVYLVVNDADVPSETTYIPGANSSLDVFWESGFEQEISFQTNDPVAFDYYRWICPALPDDTRCDAQIDRVKASATDWAVGSEPVYPVQYCLSKKIDSRCMVMWNFPIAYFVTAANLLKTLLIFYTVFGIKESPLMTIGDAVSSFLEKEDASTTNMCLTSIEDIKTTRRGLAATIGPRRWAGKRFKTKDGVSRSRRTITLLM